MGERQYFIRHLFLFDIQFSQMKCCFEFALNELSSVKMGKIKCRFTDSLREKYPCLMTVKTDSDLRCKKCYGTFSILRHLKTQKHIDAVASASTSTKSITNYFNSDENLELSAMEGVWAYHLLCENQSFRSSDCATKIFQTCFGLKKFTCSRTKCEAIINGVFAPHSNDLLKADLKEAHYVSLYTAASNHGAEKLFPVLARYFLPTGRIRVKMLEFAAETGESSDKITNIISRTAKGYELEKKFVGFCGDNAKANFGGDTRSGSNNVFYKLILWIPYLLGIGCGAHIGHNSLRHACIVIPFDAEAVVVKIYSHFYIYAVRTAALASFCDEADVEYEKLLGYAKTRFLALGPAIKRILRVFDGLKLYFESLQRGEKMIKDFFDEPSSKFWLFFLEEQVSSNKQ